MYIICNFSTLQVDEIHPCGWQWPVIITQSIPLILGSLHRQCISSMVLTWVSCNSFQFQQQKGKHVTMLCPANTQRNKHVIITSKQRFDVIITCLLRLCLQGGRHIVATWMKCLPFWNNISSCILSSSDVISAASHNTSRPRQNGHQFPDDIFKCISLNENVSISIKIPKGPINNIPALV